MRVLNLTNEYECIIGQLAGRVPAGLLPVARARWMLTVDCFFVPQVIGKNVGQFHKREMVVKDLPSLKKIRRKRRCLTLDDFQKMDCGLSSLFDQQMHISDMSQPGSSFDGSRLTSGMDCS